jgi:hypothetical protein
VGIARSPAGKHGKPDDKVNLTRCVWLKRIRGSKDHVDVRLCQHFVGQPDQNWQICQCPTGPLIGKGRTSAAICSQQTRQVLMFVTFLANLNVRRIQYFLS